MPKVKKQKIERNLPAGRQEVEEIEAKKAGKKEAFYQAIGRRKEATARVRLYVVSEKEILVSGKMLKKGDIIVNNRPVEKYFTSDAYKKTYLEPFRITNTTGRFAISAIISGGGSAGQLGAFIHGVARALEKVDKEKFRPLLKKSGFMSRDPRTKERHKAGFAQKARARKQSPKR